MRARKRPWGPGPVLAVAVVAVAAVPVDRTAKIPVDPFSDHPEGDRAYMDTAEAEFRRGVVH